MIKIIIVICCLLWGCLPNSQWERETQIINIEKKYAQFILENIFPLHVDSLNKCWKELLHFVDSSSFIDSTNYPYLSNHYSSILDNGKGGLNLVHTIKFTCDSIPNDSNWISWNEINELTEYIPTDLYNFNNEILIPISPFFSNNNMLNPQRRHHKRIETKYKVFSSEKTDYVVFPDSIKSIRISFVYKIKKPKINYFRLYNRSLKDKVKKPSETPK